MEILKCLIASTPTCTRQIVLLYFICKKDIVLYSPSESVIDMFLTLLYGLKASFLFSVVTLREVEKKSNRVRLTVKH